MPATEVIVLNCSCAMTLKEILGLPELILLYQSRHHNYSQGDIMTCGVKYWKTMCCYKFDFFDNL